MNYSAAGSVTVFVARTDQPVGAVLTARDITERTIDIDPALLGPALSKPELLGARLTTSLPAGAIVRKADLVPSDLFAGAPPDLVFTVVTIENAGILAYLRPGMSVDLLTSQPSEQGSAGGELAQGAIVMALGPDGDLSTLGTNSTTPWAQPTHNNEYSSTVLVATTLDQSKALAISSHWQGVHAIIVQ